MHLTLEQQRVDGAAEIVDHRIAFNGNCPGIRIDLDLDDVAAVRESLCRRRARMCCVKTGCHARRQFGGISRRLRRLENVQMKIGARHAEHPSLKLTSCADTSRTCAASCLPFSMIASPAS